MIWRLFDAGLVLLGAGLAVAGVAQINRPAAWIVAGLILVALGLMKTRRT